MNYNLNIFKVSFKSFLVKFVITAGLVFTLGFGSVFVNAQNSENLLEIVKKDVDTSVFLQAVQKAGIEDLLTATGPNTIFVPSNDAFKNLPTGLMDRLLLDGNKEVLKKILLYHITPQDLNSKQVIDSGSFAAVSGGNILVSQNNNSVFLNDDSRIVRVDSDGNNGYIHLINKVLIPQDADVLNLIAQMAEMTPRTGGFGVSYLTFTVVAIVALIGVVASFGGSRMSMISAAE